MRFNFLASDAKKNYDQLLLLVLVLTTPLLFLGGQLLPDTEQYKSLWNLGHIPFSLAVVLFVHNRINLSGWKRGAWLVLFVFLISIFVELLQAAIGREASIYDIIRNFIGAGIVWFWIQARNTTIWLGRTLFLVLLLIESLKTGKLFYGQYLFEKQLPVISDFEHAFDLQRWQGPIEISDKVSSSGSFSLKATLESRPYANIQLQGNPQDWSNFKRLSFDIYSEQQNNIELMLRIHDEDHAFGPYRWRYGDRFNKKLALNTGWNHYELPLDSIKSAPTRRDINLKKISNFQIFVIDTEKKIVVYIDNLRLY